MTEKKLKNQKKVTLTFSRQYYDSIKKEADEKGFPLATYLKIKIMDKKE